MNIEKIYKKKIKSYNTLKKRDLARFAEKLFKTGNAEADTRDKELLAYYHRKGKISEESLYKIMRMGQLG